MPIDYAVVGAKLKAARLAAGMTQLDVAKSLRGKGGGEMSTANVSLIESGARTPIENIEDYAKLVGCDCAVIFADRGDQPALLAARIARLIAGFDPERDRSLIRTLSAQADGWERDQIAARLGNSDPIK